MKLIDLEKSQSKLLVKNGKLEFLSKKYGEDMCNVDLNISFNGLIFGKGKLGVRKGISNSMSKDMEVYILTMDKQTRTLKI